MTVQNEEATHQCRKTTAEKPGYREQLGEQVSDTAGLSVNADLCEMLSGLKQ